MAHDDSTAVIVLTTLPLDSDVDELASTLIERRLVACVNVLPPMQSIYRWQGQVETAEERQVLMKTERGRLPELETALTEWHPYEVPEFLVIPVAGGSAAYLAWLTTETTRPWGKQK
jgi:periplasmic divalent cation tolerance protein